ncbi:hypothetical protein QQS21_003848 [Conoideocrella luteorostrata]|uniref:Uncharacterized protein n=1 Tax=Conoideocrella luteorostrata TaxID=1105319 RepID=A0AAJ0CSP6_9HYPO|nr:hypothetical protein QQS21_003848 [Conoideocrella luteorostrata]
MSLNPDSNSYYYLKLKGYTNDCMVAIQTTNENYPVRLGSCAAVGDLAKWQLKSADAGRYFIYNKGLPGPQTRLDFVQVKGGILAAILGPSSNEFLNQRWELDWSRENAFQLGSYGLPGGMAGMKNVSTSVIAIIVLSDKEASSGVLEWNLVAADVGGSSSTQQSVTATTTTATTTATSSGLYYPDSPTATPNSNATSHQPTLSPGAIVAVVLGAVAVGLLIIFFTCGKSRNWIRRALCCQPCQPAEGEGAETPLALNNLSWRGPEVDQSFEATSRTTNSGSPSRSGGAGGRMGIEGASTLSQESTRPNPVTTNEWPSMETNSGF